MPFDFDIDFAHFPRIEELSIFLFPEKIEDLTLFFNPSINRSMANIYSIIIKQFLGFTIAQVVTNSDNNHVFWELFAFEMIHSSVLAIFFLILH